MKSTRTLMSALTALIAAAVVMAGCASNKGAAGTPPAPKTPEQKTELLDWQNAALNAAVPEWVTAAAESNIRVQTLKDFKDQYCFVILLEDETNKDYAVGWVENTANGAAQVGTIMSTTVNNRAEAAQDAKRRAGQATEGVNSEFSELRSAMSNASFAGLNRAATFWTLSRNGATGRQYYTAYALWIIDQKRLDDQVAQNIEKVLAENNQALGDAERAIYRDVIDDIRARGILGQR